jgi:hypothetical protein
VLHAVHDIWETLSSDSEPDDNMTEPQAPQEQLCLAISKSAVSGAPAPRTIQFIGSIQGVPITILLDSGSMSSFISTSVVQQLSSQIVLSSHASVSVAGGGVLNSPRILQNALWFIDDYSFTANLKLLPLTHFDMVLGMDWLEQFIPMHVH